MSKDSRLSRHSRFPNQLVVLTTLIIMISVRTLYYILAAHQLKMQVDAASSSRIHGVVDANVIHNGGTKSVRKRHHKHSLHQGDDSIVRHDTHNHQSPKKASNLLPPTPLNPLHHELISSSSLNELVTIDLLERVGVYGNKDRNFIRRRETGLDFSDGVET